MHAAALARSSGIKRVVIPPMPGTFSAWGMLMTNPRVDLTRTNVLPLESDHMKSIFELFDGIGVRSDRQISRPGLRLIAALSHRHALDMRYHGQEHTVRLPLDGMNEAELIVEAFHRAHKRQYTFALEGSPSKS